MGNEALVSCPHPDHEDRNPSASINVSKRLWTCYSCGAGGTLEALLGGRISDPDTDDLIEELNETLNTVGERQRVYPERWLDQFEVDEEQIQAYWVNRRGFSEELCRTFRLGYDGESERATFPLRSPIGEVWGVVGRATGAQLPKYLYPSHAPVSTTLFGYHLVRTGRSDIVLVEGALDALAMWDVGLPAVAQLGGSLSERQETLLKRLGLRTLTLAFDNDKAGEKATQSVLRRFNWVSVRRMRWDEAVKDVDDLMAYERREAYESAEVVL